MTARLEDLKPDAQVRGLGGSPGLDPPKSTKARSNCLSVVSLASASQCLPGSSYAWDPLADGGSRQCLAGADGPMTRIEVLTFVTLANAVLKNLVGKALERVIHALWSSDGRSGAALAVVP